MSMVLQLVAFLMLLTSPLVQAQTDAATTERLLRQSGWWDQVGVVSASFPGAMMQGVEQAARAPSSSEKARIQQRAEQAFAVDKLRAVLAAAVSSGMQPDFAGPLLDWYGSGSGQRIRQTEIDATAEQASLKPEELLRKGGGLWLQLPPTRRTLLEEIIVATQAKEFLLQMTENSVLAMQRGLALADPGRQRPSDAQLRRALAAQRPAMLKTIQAMTESSVALTYRDVPDRVLSDYLAFCSSPEGRHFNDLGLQAFDKAFADAIEQLMLTLPGTRDNRNI
jgi:hypothetical protein